MDVEVVDGGGGVVYLGHLYFEESVSGGVMGRGMEKGI